MTAAPMPTPAEFAVVDTLIAIGLIAIMAGLAWAVRWAWRSWQQAGRDIDEAIIMVCQPCNGYSRTAECTCPVKCIAAVCMAPAVKR
jgi:hypothetical protein